VVDDDVSGTNKLDSAWQELREQIVAREQVERSLEEGQTMIRTPETGDAARPDLAPPSQQRIDIRDRDRPPTALSLWLFAPSRESQADRTPIDRQQCSLRARAS
jgi:hypothetical protein